VFLVVALEEEVVLFLQELLPFLDERQQDLRIQLGGPISPSRDLCQHFSHRRDEKEASW